MPRVKRGVAHVKRRKKVMARVKGFRGARKNLWKLAKVADTRAGMHSYRDRRKKKRQFRSLWNVRINAGVRPAGLSYSAFIGAMKKKQIGLNRKVLSELAKERPEIFQEIVKAAQ